jgi:hypothetical protein
MMFTWQFLVLITTEEDSRIICLPFSKELFNKEYIMEERKNINIIFLSFERC